MRCNAVVLSAIVLLAGCSVGGGETTDEQVFELGEHLTESGPVGNSLRRVDPATMLPTRALALGDYVTSRVLSPDGRTMAFGAASDGRIVFVDLATMKRRSVRITKEPYRSVWVLSWPTRRMLVAASCHDAGKFGCFEARLWRLDPTNPGERRAQTLPPVPQAAYDERTKRTFLLVRARRVIVVEPDGRLRAVALRHAATALAVDTGRAEAIAVGPGAPVAAIDVSTLSVSDHRVRGLDPTDREIRRVQPREWTGTVSPHETSYRGIESFGGGRFVVQIHESRLTRGGRAVHELWRQAWLDTRRWRAKPAPNASWLEPEAGVVIAHDRRRRGRSLAPSRLVAYEPDGDVRYRLDGREDSLREWVVAGGLIYGGVSDGAGSMTRVFDVTTGRLVAKIPPRTLAWDTEPPAFRWSPRKG
jgi:hypothetical protein